jgi:hypothetical protein
VPPRVTPAFRDLTPLTNSLERESHRQILGKPGKTSRDGRVRRELLSVRAWVGNPPQRDVRSHFKEGTPRGRDASPRPAAGVLF